MTKSVSLEHDHNRGQNVLMIWKNLSQCNAEVKQAKRKWYQDLRLQHIEE